jgi:uncharacterized protein YdeI (YjbR/CyaY-like superfamily)
MSREITMETKDGFNYLHANTPDEWYKWLEKNGESTKTIRLVIPNKNSKQMGITNNEATEAALCYGWIDSLAGKYDEGRSWLTFTPRNPKSNWSKPNRERAAKLIAAGQMRPQGQKMIDLAKKTGTWDLLADAEEGKVPDDFLEKLQENKAALTNFEAFPPSSRKRIVIWIITAKRPETRQKRIEEAVALAEKNIKANHPA